MSSDEPVEVLVRADAGPRIGSGHVMRCLTLAAHLRSRHVRVQFAMRRAPEHLRARVLAEGHEVVDLDVDVPDHQLHARPWPREVQERDVEAVSRALSRDVDAVVVDHYGLDAHWEGRVRARARRVVVIDDLADRDRDADVLVDQNWYGPATAQRHAGRVPPGSLLLLGPRYALLQPDYARVREQREAVVHPPRRVVVSYGGADVAGVSERAVAALATPDLADLEVDVVMGSRSAVTPGLEAAVRARPRTRLHVGLPTLAHLLGRADLALGASGAATWERICLGVPGIVTTTRRSQSGVTAALAEAGLTTWAGTGADLTVDDHRRLIRGAITTRPPVPPALVDGEGARRVAEAVVPTRRGRLWLDRATHLDLPIHIGDDPGGRPRSRHVLAGPEVWAAEALAFEGDLVDGDVVRAVVRLDELAVGRVRARRDGARVVVAYSLDDVVASRGWSSTVRDLAVHAAWSTADGRLGFRVGVRHPAADAPDPARGDVVASAGEIIVPLASSGSIT